MISGCIEDLLLIGQKLHKMINNNEDDDGHRVIARVTLTHRV